MERGVKSPSWGKLVALADALGVSVAVLAQAAQVEAHVALAAFEARARAEGRS